MKKKRGSPPRHFVVRDERRPGHAWFYHSVHDRFARVLAGMPWCVYTSLCRLANTSGSSHPSVAFLAKTWNVDRSTVKRAIRKLRDFGLVHRKITGRVAIYTLLDSPRKKNRGVTNAPSERLPMPPLRGHQWPIEQELLEQELLEQEGEHSRSSKQAPPLRRNGGFSQKDFDERDYRKLRKEIEALVPARTGAAVGSDRREPEEVEVPIYDPKCKRHPSPPPAGHYCSCIRFEMRPNPRYQEWLEERDRIWIGTMKLAGQRAGLLPHRVVQLLEQVYPDDPRVQMIAKKNGAQK